MVLGLLPAGSSRRNEQSAQQHDAWRSPAGGRARGALDSNRRAPSRCFDAASDLDFCGSKSAGSCWCDEQCEFYGDCCGDIALACGTGEGTGDTGEPEDPLAALGLTEDQTYWVAFEVGNATYNSGCPGGLGYWFPETGSFAFQLDANENAAGGYWLETDEVRTRASTGYGCARKAATRLVQRLATNVLLVPDATGVLAGTSQWKGPGAHTPEHAVVTTRIENDELHVKFDGSAFYSDYSGNRRYGLKATFVLTSDDVTLP